MLWLLELVKGRQWCWGMLPWHSRMLPAPITQPVLQLKTHLCHNLFSISMSLLGSAHPSQPKERWHLLLLKARFSKLPCSKEEGDGERQRSAPLAFVLCWGFRLGLVGFDLFVKGGPVPSPSLFLLSMESFASAHPCDWKKSQFLAAEQGGCFFALFLLQTP